MDSICCPICRGDTSWPLPFDAGDEARGWLAEAGLSEGYNWRLCRRCGNAFPSRQPSLQILSRIWEANRRLDAFGAKEAEAARAYRIQVSRIGAERAYRLYAPLKGGGPGRFLDIACGLGETVHRFARAGWIAEGIDADPSTKLFHDTLGITSRIGQVEAQRFDGLFDMIQISHAIYFITEPMIFLDTVKRLLASDGIFCVSIADFMAANDISTPNYAHSFFPTAASMRYMLTLAGFQVIFSRRWSGTVYMAARKGAAPLPAVRPALIRLGYQTKELRYNLFAKPLLPFRRLAKRLLRRS